MSDRLTVAILGAGGTMGLGMARNIAAAGFPVHAWNRSREKAQPLADDGVSIFDTAAQAAEGAAIVVTMLTDADTVLEVMDGERGVLATNAGHPLWLQMSTIGVAGTERCAELAERVGVELVDAPVLGTKQPAEKGELVVLASGPPQTRQTVEPIFDAVGKKTMWLGEAGTGSRLKVVINSWIVTIVEGAAETIALAEGAGLDPRLFLEAVADGPLDLPYLKLKGKAIVERDFEPSFRLALGAKDANLAEELATRHELELPLIETICNRLAEAVAEHGDEDISATYWTSAPSGERAGSAS
jgi:3-hydroxyisobutyrate dehydrogenase